MSIRHRNVGRLVLVGCLGVSLSGRAVAQAPPLWGKLPPGSHAVGFQSGWQLDYVRRYNMTFDDGTSYAAGKGPRPILVNRWYPAVVAADARKMPHGMYLNVRTDDPALAKYAARLAEYERSVIAKEVMGKPLKDLTKAESALLDEFFDTPTACVRDAAPAKGNFPLVIYHAGAGSSFEDNAVFCEFLASHGFVVLGSAFPQGSGQSFNTDNREGSHRDLDFLIAHVRQLPNVDSKHIGLIGHSAGAQASLTYCARAGCPIDAVVSLDTTQDYRGVKDPLWSFTPQMVKNASEFTSSVLMTAGPQAFFELADLLRNAERHYLTIDHLDHNDYIAQGGIHRERMVRLRRDDPGQDTKARAEEEAELPMVRESYRALCVNVLRFFEAKLKDETAAQKFLSMQYRETKFGSGEPHVDYMAKGRTGPERYVDGDEPPSPRQLRPYLREHGNQKTIALMRRFREKTPAHPIFNDNFKFFLVGDLLDQGKVEDAIALRDYFRETKLNCNEFFLVIGKSYEGQGLMKPAAVFYRRLLRLDPANAEAAARLKEVEAKLPQHDR
jgi:pimeloyl-ACP methyl ester carboxylesterase